MNYEIIVVDDNDKDSEFYNETIKCQLDYKDKNNIKFLETPGASFQDTSFSFKTLHPKSFSILQAVFTSSISGQPLILDIPLFKIVAAKIGSTEFFEPWSVISPLRGLSTPSTT